MRKLLFFIGLLFPTFAFSAMRTNTIEYSFYQSTAQVSGGGVRTFDPITVYIPETTGRKFVDVYAYTHVQDSATVAGSPSSMSHGLGIGSVAFSSITVTDTLTNSGENMAFFFISTFTNYFNANFTGTSQTVNFTMTMGGSMTNNCSSKLVVTYEYDDSETTRIKTVRLPIQGSTGTLTTTNLKMDSIPGSSAQIPALDTFLPEQGKTIRDIFFEIDTNDHGTAATGVDAQMGLTIDSGGTEYLDAPHSRALISSRRYYRIFKRPDIDTASTHDLYARTTNTNMGFNVMSVLMTVTYEYNVTTSTEFINSMALPINSNDTVAGGTTRNNPSVIIKKFTVPETNPVLLHTGIVMNTLDANSPSIFMWSGNQVTVSSYTFPAVTASGDKLLSHRADRNNGFSIRTGTNTYVLRYFRNGTTSGNLVSHFSGTLYVNYKSSGTIQSGGDSNFNKTIFYQMIPYQPDAIENFSISTAPIINETTYYLNDVGFRQCNMKTMISGQNVSNLKITIASDTVDGVDVGWVSDIKSFLGEGEFGPYNITNDMTRFFNQSSYQNDRSKLNIETTRTYSLNSAGETVYHSGILFITYNSMVFNVSGTVSGYSGGGGGISIDVFNAITNELIASGTTSSGGTFNVPVHSSDPQVYVTAYQSSSYKGVSAIGTPGTSTFDISFTSGGSTGGTSFGFVGP